MTALLSRLKIAYVLGNAPFGQSEWAVAGLYAAKMLDKEVGEVHYLDPVPRPWWFRRGLLGSWYSTRQLLRRLDGQHFDCVLVVSDFSEASFIGNDVPVFYITDVTFPLMTSYLPALRKAGFFFRWQSRYLERRMFRRSRALVLTSQWAADSVIRDYKISKTKVNVLLPGANLDEAPRPDLVRQKFDNPSLTVIFFSKAWEQQGGAIVSNTFRLLKATFPDAHLIICGCAPPSDQDVSGVTVIPPFDREDPGAEARRSALLASVHFLLQPTRGDSFLPEAAEANAYGIPVITTETGGVTDLVQDGVNGYCLPYQSDSRIYAFLISELFMDKEHYRELVGSSRERYENRLNWATWALGVREVIRKAVDKPAHPH